MDIFEKQQTIEAIKTVVKTRWFFVLIIVVQAVIVKIFFKGVPLPTASIIFLVAVIALLFNFGYWLYLRRPIEKTTNRSLEIIKFLQIAVDQIAYWFILYFSGTANKMLWVAYILVIMISIALYGKKGVFLTAIAGSILYSGLVIMEYFGLLHAMPPEVFVRSPTLPLKGDWFMTAGQLVGFNSYLFAATAIAVYLGGLFKIREKRLKEQKDELAVKAQVLTTQTQELTKTKDYLHEALTKSDKSRVELMAAQKQLETKIRELEKYGEVTTGREIRMIELKQKIKNLEEIVKDLQNQIANK